MHEVMMDLSIMPNNDATMNGAPLNGAPSMRGKPLPTLLVIVTAIRGHDSREIPNITHFYSDPLQNNAIAGKEFIFMGGPASLDSY